MSGILTFVSSGPESTIASTSALATEAALVAAAKNGDGQAFETLVKRYQRRILTIAARYTRVRYDAEDVVQLTFQKAFVYLHTFEGKSSFSTWLTRIAINEALMFLRRRRGQREISIDGHSIHEEEAASRSEIPAADPDPETSYLRQEEARILSAALRELRPGLRRAIELRELAELSTEETARRMGLSIFAVKARVFHGRRKLREALRRCLRKTHKRRKTMKPQNPRAHAQSVPEESGKNAPSAAETRQRTFEIHIKRGGIHGWDLDDWLQAEGELQEK